MLRLCPLIACLLVSVSLLAQTKRPLSHADYDRWQSIRAEKMSDNGQWISYQIDPQEGDGVLELKKADGSQTRRFSRGYMALHKIE